MQLILIKLKEKRRSNELSCRIIVARREPRKTLSFGLDRIIHVYFLHFSGLRYCGNSRYRNDLLEGENNMESGVKRTTYVWHILW